MQRIVLCSRLGRFNVRVSEKLKCGSTLADCIICGNLRGIFAADFEVGH